MCIQKHKINEAIYKYQLFIRRDHDLYYAH
jgi:hypothetical protein